MSSSDRRHSIAIQDGIKASLATLELVHRTSRTGDEALSNSEVESAHASLANIIETAEAIKERLPSSIASTDDPERNLPSARNHLSSALPASLLEQKNAGAAIEEGPESQNKGDDDGDDEEPSQQRRLSTPFLMPMDTSDLRVSYVASGVYLQPNTYNLTHLHATKLRIVLPSQKADPDRTSFPSSLGAKLQSIRIMQTSRLEAVSG